LTLSLRALNRARLARQLLLTRSPMSALDAIELKHLVSCVSPKGILIIDDYGHWRGASKAVDEWLAEFERPVFLSRIDYTGRIAVLP
jgi:hypothetical protein